MLYDVKTPEAYLEALEDDWRKSHLLHIRSLILGVAPDLLEKINYKMLAFGTEGQEVFHLNAQRGYVSLYVGNIERIDPDRSLLSGYSMGKGCIRFRKTANIDNPNLVTFIEKVIDMWRDGAPTGC